MHFALTHLMHATLPLACGLTLMVESGRRIVRRLEDVRAAELRIAAARQELAVADDELLEDVGLTRGEVGRLVGFGRAPGYH